MKHWHPGGEPKGFTLYFKAHFFHQFKVPVAVCGVTHGWVTGNRRTKNLCRNCKRTTAYRKKMTKDQYEQVQREERMRVAARVAPQHPPEPAKPVKKHPKGYQRVVRALRTQYSKVIRGYARSKPRHRS